MKKQCLKCKRILPYSEFHKDKTHSNGIRSRCKECTIIDHREENVILKQEVMTAFGGRCVHVDKNGIQCTKNLVNDFPNLDLIHPNGDGDEHRALINNGRHGYSFYRALKKRSWDTDGFVVQIMCKSHHRSLDHSGTKHSNYGKYKKGKFNSPNWLKKKYETMTLQEIADLCGVCESTIFDRMVRFNISRRKRGSRP